MAGNSAQRTSVQRAAEALPLCLVFSGGAALIYEVVWLRQISLVMGHTALALAALLTAFLGGLALGAALGGRLAERGWATARRYALIEVLVALGSLAVPLVLQALDPLFGIAYRQLGAYPLAFGLAQLLLCGVALAVPCVLMGMTLPIVVAASSAPGHDPTHTVGRLYALNSLGGIIGAGMAGLLLLPRLGESGAIWVAVAMNLSAAAFAILSTFEDDEAAAASQSPAPRPPAAPRDDAWAAPGTSQLIGLYGLAGAAALVLQVGWARLVGLSVGSTSYGFTITLVSFITGLTLGSGFGVRLRWVRADPVRALFFLHAGIGLWTLVTLPALGALPDYVGRLMGTDLPFFTLWWAQLALVFCTIVVPTFAMGAIFPLVCALMRRGLPSSGRAVGRAYAANTFGNITGAALAGFVLIPSLGMRGTIVLSAVVSVMLALAYLRPTQGALRARGLAGLLALATALAAWGMPSWDRDIVSSGPFLRGYQGARSGENAGRVQGRLIDYVEGPTTVAAVRDRGGLKELYVGGISEASSNSPMHLYLGHQAMLLHGAPKNVLLVGLGTGRTLGALIQYPVHDVQVMELSPEVVQLAKRHFSEGISLAFEDPRVVVRAQDGRAHLRHSARTYDVIISQPSYPWAAGAARLFTKEYFELIKGALAPGGVAVVWFPTRFEPGAQSVMAAWSEVFDEPHLFSPDERYRFHFAVGFGADKSLGREAIQTSLSYPKVARAAAALGLRQARDVLAAELPWPDLSGVPVNTDDNGYVEHAAFRALMDERRNLP